MKPRMTFAILARTLGLLALILLSAPNAWAQLRIVGALSGTVQDPTGAVVPNAKVTLRDEKTGISRNVTSTELGTFLFPDLAVGAYEVTVAAPGFQNSRVSSIAVSTSQTTDVRVNLTVGAATETVTVNGGDAQTLETSSQLVASTLNSQTVNQLPVASREGVLNLARLAPGASPPTGGSTRYNNLAGGAVNVTVDGINNASNGFKSGGTVFFAEVRVRPGAVEEVSVETAGLGADSGAQSGANIKFTTRRGGAQYHGSGFYEQSSDQLNANTWTRNANTPQVLPRAYNRLHTYGGNFGGRLVPFGYLKDKLFFFANYERVHNPQFTQITVQVPTADAQRGIYKYLATGSNEIRSVNVLDLAAARNLPVRLDPVAQAIININNDVPKYARLVTGTDLNRNSYIFNSENNSSQYYPATRVDYFITPKQQATFTWNYRHTWQPGARRLPNPDIQRTNPFRVGYYVFSTALQSTFTPNTFNEFRFGMHHSGDTNTRDEYGPFYKFNGKPLRIGGTLPFNVTTPFIDQGNVTGRHPVTTLYDTLTLNRGQHTYTFGGSYRKTVWNDVAVVYQVPTYGTGTPSGDPLGATNAFTTTTLPGINNTELTNVQALYNLLTGRVASSNFTRNLNPSTLQYDGIQEQSFTWTNSKMGGFFAQDRWRIRRSLTLNYGLRWEIQGPLQDGKGITAAPDLASIFGPSKRLFAPGELSGNNNPTLTAGQVPYKTDWKNFAPNFGFAWNPNKTDGWLGKVLGGQKTVFRASYSIIVYDEGTQFFSSNLGGNAGKQISATTLIPGTPGATNLPSFYTLNDIVNNPLTVANFAFATTEYKKTVNQSDQTFVRTIGAIDPNLRAPYTENYTFGIQRELWKNTSLEVRYVGNASRLAWRTSNLNEVNIFENGFLNEFKNAQKNLAINVAAGVQSFQNLGRAGQVALPIFDAAFGARGGLTAIAATSGYTSTGFITNLQNGEAGSLATTLATNQNYVCRMFGSNFSPCARVQPLANTPGPYPLNFFLLNPFVAGRLNYVDNGGWHNYNGLQIQFRQRMGQSLNWNLNYTLSKSLTNLTVDTATQGLDYVSLRDPGLNKRPSQFDLRHVIQAYGTYELPVGHGKLLSFHNKLIDNLAGGWLLGQVFVFNTGQPIQLTGGFNTVNNSNNAAIGGVRLASGVTLDQIQKLFDAERVRISGRPAGTFTDLQRIAVDSSLIGSDFRANPALLTYNSTPGEFGQLLFLRDKNTFQWDASLTKRFSITEKTKAELFAGFNNLLNHPRWGLPDTNVFSQTFGVVGAPSNNRSINLRGTLSF